MGEMTSKLMQYMLMIKHKLFISFKVNSIKELLIQNHLERLLPHGYR